MQASLGDSLPAAHSQRAGDRSRAEPSAENIAFNEIARQAILTDPEFHGGNFQCTTRSPPGAARRADDRAYRVSVRPADGRRFGRQSARG